MKEVSNGKKQIDEQKVEKVEKIKNEKVEKKNISKEEKKEKIKKFIEKGKKEKKVKYKDIVKFVDEAEITPEEMAKIYPAAIVTSYITIGGTDSYKYQTVSDDIYRFLPICLNQYEQRTIHNENEYISLENFGKMQWYFKELMKNY